MKNNMWKKFLVTDISNQVISIFKNVFLGIYFLKLTEGNIINVSLFYITHYIFYTIFFYLVNRLRKIDLVKLLRIGLFINLIKCIVLLLSGEKIVNYIIIFAMLDSLGNAFYYYSQTILVKRLNDDNNFTRYFTINNILQSVLSITIPVIFGYCITNNSYRIVFIILIIFTSISFIFSFLIKGYNLKHSKINLKKFYSGIKKRNQTKVMALMSLRVFFRSLSSSGVLSTLLTIITFFVVSNELSLGSISSFITIISTIVIYVLNNYVKKETMTKMFLPIAILQSTIIILLTISMIYFNIENNITIFAISINLGFILVLLYNIVNGICNPIFEVSNNIVYYEYMDKYNITEDDEPNFAFWFEIGANISRIIGYIILIFVSIIGFNLNIIACLIVVFSLMYIAFAYTLKKINREYLL